MRSHTTFLLLLTSTSSAFHESGRFVKKGDGFRPSLQLRGGYENPTNPVSARKQTASSGVAQSRSGEEQSFPSLINLVGTVYIGTLGLLLITRPAYVFGANGRIPFFDVESFDPLEEYYARMNGALYAAVAARGMFAPNSISTTRFFTMLGFVSTGLWVIMACFTNSTPFLVSSWKPQIIFHCVVMLWGLIRCFADRQDEVNDTSVGLVNKIAMVYACIAGLALSTNPSYFFGESGLVPFFAGTAEFSTLGTYFARALGATLFTSAAGSYLFAKESIATTKMLTVASGLCVPLFIRNLFDKSGVFLTNGNWNKQITTNVLLAVFLWYYGFHKD